MCTQLKKCVHFILAMKLKLRRFCYTFLIKSSAQLIFNFSMTALVEEVDFFYLDIPPAGCPEKIMNLLCVTYDQDCILEYPVR